ncbi:hypothetical protein [Thiohalobacter thiocyanaticus]|uniref:hypothetical protein n=1 Tax=Thiohalobacter thiocyanaticus TaxID=585455 RepID=UPI000F630184|nr:hypothetical protein [Thiohalobacter thiocyanaticus]
MAAVPTSAHPDQAGAAGDTAPASPVRVPTPSAAPARAATKAATPAAPATGAVPASATVTGSEPHPATSADYTTAADTGGRAHRLDDADDGDDNISAAAPVGYGTHRAAEPTQAATASLSYYNSGYTSAGREQIRSALQAGDGDVIHISNAGDQILVSRNTAVHLPTGSGPGSAGRRRDQSNAPDASEPRLGQEPEQPHMATPNCPGIMPETTSEEAVRSMVQNYGCRYLLTCRLSNDGNDQVLCVYTFAGVNG